MKPHRECVCAAQEREACATYAKSVIETLEARFGPSGCTNLAPAVRDAIRARGSAPAPRCKDCGAHLDVMGGCMSARMHPTDDARAKALVLIRTIASTEHFEECDYSALDHGEKLEPDAVCSCCQSCTDARDNAIRALALLEPKP